MRPGLPPGLSDVVHRALAASPARRFASAEEFAQALQPFSRVKAEGAAPAPAAVAKAGKAKAGTVKAAKGKAFSWSSVLGGVAALGLLSYYYLTKEPDVTAELPPASSAPPKFQLAAPSQVAAPPIAASAAAPPLAPSQVAAPSATAPVAAAPSATPAAAGPSASADVPSPAASGSAGSEQSLLCYLNRVSGVVSTRGPGCRQPVFAKPNMKMRARFPKWIPPYCSELAVFHCETASAPAPSPAPSPEPEGG